MGDVICFHDRKLQEMRSLYVGRQLTFIDANIPPRVCERGLVMGVQVFLRLFFLHVANLRHGTHPVGACLQGGAPYLLFYFACV